MDPKAIYERLSRRFGEVVLSFGEPAPIPPDKKDTPEALEFKKKLDEKRRLNESFAFVTPKALPEVARYLRDDVDLWMDFLMCLSGVDTKTDLQVVYHFYSYRLRHKFALKVTLPRDD